MLALGLVLAQTASARPLARAAILPPVPADDYGACQQAISVTEHAAKLPPKLMAAIGIVETGRINPHGGTVSAWPWTINVAGAGHFFGSKDEAISAVQTAQAAGVQSIDVGCMQINLLHHPHAFATLEDAFDPVSNVKYAASFLNQLYHQTETWAQQWPLSFLDARHWAEYGQRVAAIWPLAESFGMHPGDPVHIAGGQPAPPAQPVVDPYHVLTPEFKAQLLQEAAFRKARDATLGVGPVSPAADILARRSHIHLPGSNTHLMLRASIGD